MLMKTNRKIKLGILAMLLVTLLFAGIPASAHTAGAQYYSVTYGYTSGSCDTNTLTCDDYYADHFDLKVYWNPAMIYDPPAPRIIHAHATLLYDNQNGDEWAAQRLAIWGSNSNSSTPAYESYEHSTHNHTLGNSTFDETWDFDVIVPSKNNYIMGYFKYALKAPGGSPAGTFYPKRYRQNI